MHTRSFSYRLVAADNTVVVSIVVGIAACITTATVAQTTAVLAVAIAAPLVAAFAPVVAGHAIAYLDNRPTLPALLARLRPARASRRGRGGRPRRIVFAIGVGHRRPRRCAKVNASST